MKRLLKLLTIVPYFVFSQNDTIRVTEKGFNTISIYKTNIKEAIKIYGESYQLKKVDYTYAVSASHDVGVVPLLKTKTFYSYPELGLEFITTENNIISGVIFKAPAKVKTTDKVIMNKTTTKDLEELNKKKEGKNLYPIRNIFGFESRKYSSKTSHAISIGRFDYCYKQRIFGKKKGWVIKEIIVGE
ncbi:MAG: hypothetical protein JWO32_1813 [Bacteroidetes bacterium]|nr:hypothetical protein [Bacteroidota bacterium]